MGNRVGGLDGVVSPVVLVLSSFIQAMKSEITNLKTVYDEKLSYETAAEAFRAANNIDEAKIELYPLFAFRRSVLRYAEIAGPGRRGSSIGARRNMDDQDKPKSSNVYGMVHGEFDVNFLYITKDIRQLELFEILYLSEDGISSYKEIDVDLFSDLGLNLKYYADYLPLEDKVFESENNVYKMIQGTVKLRGFYPVLRAEAKHILEIRARVLDIMGPVYHEELIVPT